MRATLLLLPLLLTACATAAHPGRSPFSASFGRKLVVRKYLPRELVATDGTTCLTSEKHFARVSRGDHVWCVWRDRSVRPTA
jgi:hypothetical protein